MSFFVIKWEVIRCGYCSCIYLGVFILIKSVFFISAGFFFFRSFLFRVVCFMWFMEGDEGVFGIRVYWVYRFLWVLSC